MNITIPNFWHLDPKVSHKRTTTELENEQHKETNVVYLKLKMLEHKHSVLGVKPHPCSLEKIGEIFSKFGDINVSKNFN